jgi:iron complex outermembrane receptor protein
MNRHQGEIRMNIKFGFGRAFRAAALMTVCVAASVVNAEAATEAAPTKEFSTTIDEIIVTARKIAEDVQKVPESITTFSAEQIAQAQIHSVDDFIALTPNFNIFHAETAGNFQMSIRGITQVDKGDAPVTMVIDGVTLPYASSYTRPLFDVEQIEVLKGPQGSLYGQNAIGGAIIVTTKQPTNDLQGNVDVSYGNHNSTTVTGDVGGPLVADRVFLRLAANFHNDDGDRKYLYVPNTSGDYDQSGNVRAELKALLTDKLTAYFSFGGGADKNDGLALVPVTYSTGSGIPGVSTAQVNQGLTLGQLNQDSATTATQTSVDGSLRLVYDAGFATISSVTAVEGVTEVQHQDIDVTRIPFVTVHQDQTIRSVSEELRFASEGTGPLRWVAGLFYLNNHRQENYTIGANLSLLEGLGPDPAIANFIPFEANNNDQHLKSRAIFGQASYDLIQDVELTLGARYDSDPRSQLTTGFGPGGAPLLTSQSATFNQFQPKASVKWQFTPDANVYATFAKGFRPGGFNSGVSANVENAFPAETTQTFELGAKSAFLNRSLILDVALFYTTYKNQQLGLTQVTATGVSTNTYDVSKTQIKGGEISIQAKPIRGLDIVAGFGYTDATIKEFGSSLSGVQFSPTAYVGKKTPLVPQFTFNASVQYEWPLWQGVNGIARVDVDTKGKMYWEPDNVYSQGTYTLVNPKIGLKGDKWEARLYGENVFNAKYYVIYEDNLFVQAPGGFNFAFLNLKPRFGVDVAFHF